MKAIEDIAYKSISDKDNFALIEIVKEGVLYSSFEKIYKQLPFTLEQWAGFLNTTTRTLQRWKRLNSLFSISYAERVVEIYQLYKSGVEVFGTDGLNKWLNSDIAALGDKKPISFLNNTFGIQLIKSKSGRIQHGILA